MRRSAIIASAVALSLALVGCSSAGTSESKDAGKDVQVVSWWAQGSEKAGYEALQKIFKEKKKDFNFVDAAVAGGGGSQAKQKLQADLDAGNPPETFQAHAGAELTDYIKAGQIEDVSALYDKFKLREVFPQSLIERLTVDGKIYSIPSNIHRANVLWYNPEVLKSAGIDPKKVPATIDDWIADMEKVKAAGKVPLTLGMNWTQTQLLETILIADLGAEGYNGLWDGKTDWAGAEVTKALKHFQKIVELAQTDSSADWEPTLNFVMDGKAAYNVMGDWAIAAFTAAKKEMDKDWMWAPVPGTQDVFDFLADSFTLPKGAKNPEGAKAWLEVIGSADGQAQFNLIKGSIPARTDVDTTKFPEYQQKAMEDFKSKTVVSSLAHGAAAPLAVSSAINDAVVKFTQGQGKDVEGLQKDLVNATKSLKK
ncbi:carbohydrate ABC transporter substrate-binding protein [Actinomyces sp. zg-332]|uniref:ABC transporter substrate-binding protein n=1 Tax=Actinomyces sp. zg-332 TaxID=2708340 RepID=UPI0014219464|nr:ABC transporter substrate-binding protein [Actinomyces sp. zg-332]QPK93816.1 carbohydrate ABC transporter substrate-binding protein [Actinomyces sp. zg-332]